jgi:hypothetical protein
MCGCGGGSSVNTDVTFGSETVSVSDISHLKLIKIIGIVYFKKTVI